MRFAPPAALGLSRRAAVLIGPPVDPNATTIASTYDGNAGTTGVTATNGTSMQAPFTYIYDPANQLLSETDGGAGFTGASPQRYAYTSTRRVASVNGATATYTGAFSTTGFENGTTQTYNAGSELTSAAMSGSKSSGK